MNYIKFNIIINCEWSDLTVELEVQIIYDFIKLLLPNLIFLKNTNFTFPIKTFQLSKAERIGIQESQNFAKITNSANPENTVFQTNLWHMHDGQGVIRKQTKI